MTVLTLEPGLPSAPLPLTSAHLSMWVWHQEVNNGSPCRGAVIESGAGRFIEGSQDGGGEPQGGRPGTSPRLSQLPPAHLPPHTVLGNWNLNGQPGCGPVHPPASSFHSPGPPLPWMGAVFSQPTSLVGPGQLGELKSARKHARSVSVFLWRRQKGVPLPPGWSQGGVL